MRVFYLYNTYSTGKPAQQFSFPVRKTIWYLFFLLLFSPVDAQVIPAFEQDSEIEVNAGYLRLSWNLQRQGDLNGYHFELQQASSSSFASAGTIYSGPDFATYLSGLPNGDFYFRIRSVNKEKIISDWSDPLVVRVRHHSMQLALSLFALGAVVFALTVFVVVYGTGRTKHE